MNEFDTKRDGIPVRIVETGEEFNSIQACANRMLTLNGWEKSLEEKQDSTHVMVIISSFREDDILQILH